MTLEEILASVWTLPDSGCWIWAGEWNRNGYGVLVRGRRRFHAYREVYKAIKGDIAPKLALDHLCRIKPCVNPDHLEPVTATENLRRYREIGKSARVLNVLDFRQELIFNLRDEAYRLNLELSRLSEKCKGFSEGDLIKVADALRKINIEDIRSHIAKSAIERHFLYKGSLIDAA